MLLSSVKTMTACLDQRNKCCYGVSMPERLSQPLSREDRLPQACVTCVQPYLAALPATPTTKSSFFLSLTTFKYATHLKYAKYITSHTVGHKNYIGKKYLQNYGVCFKGLLTLQETTVFSKVVFVILT